LEEHREEVSKLRKRMIFDDLGLFIIGLEESDCLIEEKFKKVI
jgi:hypothetical protein